MSREQIIFWAIDLISLFVGGSAFLYGLSGLTSDAWQPYIFRRYMVCGGIVAFAALAWMLVQAVSFIVDQFFMLD